MSDENGGTPPGPNLAEGVLASDIPAGGMLAGRVGNEGVLLLKMGDSFHAIGSSCTHYHGPLSEGVFDGELVRCPWHHACFRPQTGEAVRAPAIDPVTVYNVERRGDRVFVTSPRSPARPAAASDADHPESVVIVGGGAAGFAAIGRTAACNGNGRSHR